MSAAALKLPLAESDYLSGEEISNIRHEFLCGEVRAMAGETKRHNRITFKLAGRLDGHLTSGHCRVYMNGVKIRIPVATGVYHYYPDIIVHCGPDNLDQRFVPDATLIIEVLSPSTERMDRTEKFFMYQTLPGLLEYVLISQDQPEVTVLRRRTGWQAEVFQGADAAFTLESVDLTLTVGAACMLED